MFPWFLRYYVIILIGIFPQFVFIYEPIKLCDVSFHHFFHWFSILSFLLFFVFISFFSCFLGFLRLLSSLAMFSLENFYTYFIYFIPDKLRYRAVSTFFKCSLYFGQLNFSLLTSFVYFYIYIYSSFVYFYMFFFPLLRFVSDITLLGPPYTFMVAFLTWFTFPFKQFFLALICRVICLLPS